MKKKILALLLAAVMLLTLLPVTALAEPAEDPFEDYIEWGDDPEEEGCMPTAPGNYKLVADITIEDCWAVPKGVEETATVTNLCLNGHVLCVNAYPGIAVEQYSELNIYDTKDSNATHYLKFNEEDDRYQYVNDDPAPEGAVPVTGGLITTSRDRLGIGVGDYGRVNMYGGTIAGFARTVELNGTDCDFNMHDGKICYNYGDNESYGSAVEVLAGRFTMVGGELSHNYANCGGAVGVDDNPNASFVMTGGKITDNYAACEGGGVYFYTCDSCVAEGTLVTMADGTQKLVEELQTGDMLRIFDHKTGELGVAPLLYFLDHNEKRDGGYTLHFASGKEITAVGRHCFFEKKANNYIMLNPKTAASYIGCEFYNADEGKWETLKSVTILDEPIYCYSLMTALGNNANAVTDGLLSSELRGIFDYDEELKIDEERLAADIEKFGLMRFEDQDYFPKEVFDLLDGQYLNLIIGRGVLREDEVYSLLDAYANCFISGGQEEDPANAPMLLAASAPRLTAPHPSFGVEAPEEFFFLGGTAVIDNNYAYGYHLNEETEELIESERYESNLFLGNEKKITFGDVANGFAAPADGMRVGVNKHISDAELEEFDWFLEELEYKTETYPVQITTNCVEDWEKYIFSDDPAYYVNRVASTTDYLVLGELYTVNVSSAAGGTVTTDKQIASATELVTLTVTPDNGYALKSLSYVHTLSDWGVIGDFNGDTWTKDIPMAETESDVFVSPVLALSADDQFKVRKGAAWDVNFGATDSQEPYVVTLDTPAAVSLNGRNMTVSTTGNYVITLNLKNDPTITLTSASTSVADPVAITADAGGTYTFTMPAYPVTVTAEFEEAADKVIQNIGDVLETNPDFPTTEGEGWENGDGNFVFLDEEDPAMLDFNGVGLTLGIEVTASGEDYVYLSVDDETSEYQITFHMTDGVLTSITFEDLSDEELYGSYEGTYAPARESGSRVVLTKNVEVSGDKIKSGDKEIKVELASGMNIKDVAVAINEVLNNEAVASYTDTNLAAATEDSDSYIVAALKATTNDPTAKENVNDTNIDKYLDIELVSASVDTDESGTGTVTVTAMEFDVTPKATITVKDSTNADVTLTTEIKNYVDGEVTFRLPVASATDAKTAAVYHEGVFIGNEYIDSEGNYIEVTTEEFSKFSYILLDWTTAGAVIDDEVLYASLADAVSEVTDDQTIKLLKNASGTITVSREVTFKVEDNGWTNDAAIEAGEDYKLEKTGGLSGTTTYTITEDDSDTVTVTVPTGLSNVTHKVYVRKNLFAARTEVEASNVWMGGCQYEVPAGSTVYVVFTAREGYRIVGTNPVIYRNISDNVSVTVPTVEKGESLLPEINWEKIGQGVTLLFAWTSLFNGGRDADEPSKPADSGKTDIMPVGDLAIPVGISSITVVKIDGKTIDSKYYTVNGTVVTLKSEFVKTLSAGEHTILVKNDIQSSTKAFTVSGGSTTSRVTSAGTGDMGIVLYGVLSISSVLGMGWIGRKKRDEE